MLATMSAYRYCSHWVDELNHYLEKQSAVCKNIYPGKTADVKVVDLEATYLMRLDVSKAVSVYSSFKRRSFDF